MVRYYKKQYTHSHNESIYAVGDEETQDEWGEKGVPIAYVGYTPAKISPNWNYSNGHYQPSPEALSDFISEHDRYPENHELPTTLFTPQNAQVHSLFADHRMRAHVPNLLGHVLNQAQVQGAKITADWNLSPHSSAIVRRGIEAGLVVGHPNNPTAEVHNTMGEEGRDKYVEIANQRLFYEDEAMRDSDVKKMRAKGRDAIMSLKGKQPRPTTPKVETKPSGPQPEQLRLDI